MGLTDQINEDIKTAMKAGEKDKLMALRDIKSKLLLEMTKEGGDGDVDDTKVFAILNKLYKQRMESIEIYRQQNREDLLEVEAKQAEVIAAYLPKALSQSEIEEIIAQVITQVGAAGPSDLGKVMGAANKAMAGRADGKLVADSVKSMLAKLG
jgi:uncharacterized protein